MIPIIGQAKVHDYAVSLLVECPCGNKFLFTGQVGSMRPCGGVGCRKDYLLAGMPIVEVQGNQQMIQAPLGSRERPLTEP